MPTCLHSHAHLHSLGRELAVEPLRFLAVLQSSLLYLPGVCIYERNLLKGRVVITSYNQHIGSFSPEPFGWLEPPKFTRVESRHCHGINNSQNPPPWAGRRS